MVAPITGGPLPETLPAHQLRRLRAWTDARRGMRGKSKANGRSDRSRSLSGRPLILFVQPGNSGLRGICKRNGKKRVNRNRTGGRRHSSPVAGGAGPPVSPIEVTRTDLDVSAQRCAGRRGFPGAEFHRKRDANEIKGIFHFKHCVSNSISNIAVCCSSLEVHLRAHYVRRTKTGGRVGRHRGWRGERGPVARRDRLTLDGALRNVIRLHFDSARLLLVAGLLANRIRPKSLENAAFGSRRPSRSTVSFFWGRKWRHARAGARFRQN